MCILFATHPENKHDIKISCNYVNWSNFNVFSNRRQLYLGARCLHVNLITYITECVTGWNVCHITFRNMTLKAWLRQGLNFLEIARSVPLEKIVNTSQEIRHLDVGVSQVYKQETCEFRGYNGSGEIGKSDTNFQRNRNKPYYTQNAKVITWKWILNIACWFENAILVKASVYFSLNAWSFVY